MYAPPPPKFEASIFNPYQEVPISIRSLFITSSDLIQEQRAFRLARKNNIWQSGILHPKNMAYPSQPFFHYYHVG